jgi:hypothetical protein
MKENERAREKFLCADVCAVLFLITLPVCLMPLLCRGPSERAGESSCGGSHCFKIKIKFKLVGVQRRNACFRWYCDIGK